VVRRSRRVLGGDLRPLREESNKLPSRILVARSGRSVQSEHSGLSVSAKAGGPSVGQRRMRPLGAGCRMVQ
jgi:hypothetical protein